MNVIDLDLRDFPADVQDLLRDRAIREARPITAVMRDYALETARLIVAADEEEKGQEVGK
jgi:hypothetical protein